MAAGYSGTPLPKKLGLPSEGPVLLLREPPGFRPLLGAAAAAVTFATAARGSFPYVHLFATSRRELDASIAAAERCLADGGMLWVSWPKKASGVATDLTEDVLREVLLPRGLVDVKVCAVDETWSGLKFVRRREEKVARRK